MRALILGCGSIGSRHARNLAALGVEVAVHDPDVERATAAAGQSGALQVRDRDAVEAEILVIATPTVQHVEDLAWGVRRGMHVFVEKPLAADRAQLERARQIQGELTSQVVMVGCNLRFTRGFGALADNLHRVGRMLAVRATFGWYLPEWRPGQDYRHGYSAQRALGGGVILDAIHEIDYVLALAGPVVSSTCRWTNTRTLDIDVEDLAEIVMTHRDGSISSTHLDYLQRVYTRSCQVTGTEGTLSWDYAAHRVDLACADFREVVLEQADLDANDMYVAQLQSFLEVVRTGAPNANDLATALATTEVAVRSMEDGGAWPG